MAQGHVRRFQRQISKLTHVSWAIEAWCANLFPNQGPDGLGGAWRAGKKPGKLRAAGN